MTELDLATGDAGQRTYPFPDSWKLFPQEYCHKEGFSSHLASCTGRTYPILDLDESLDPRLIVAPCWPTSLHPSPSLTEYGGPKGYNLAMLGIHEDSNGICPTFQDSPDSFCGYETPCFSPQALSNTSLEDVSPSSLSLPSVALGTHGPYYIDCFSAPDSVANLDPTPVSKFAWTCHRQHVPVTSTDGNGVKSLGDNASSYGTPSSQGSPGSPGSLSSSGSLGSSDSLDSHVMDTIKPASLKSSRTAKNSITRRQTKLQTRNKARASLVSPGKASFDVTARATSLTSIAEDATPTTFKSRGSYTCEHADCIKTKPMFSRPADLARHERQLHFDECDKDQFYCDYPRCPRRDTSIGRKDHFREHLREYHKEDLPKRNNAHSARWLRESYVDTWWWRCTRCLCRVQVAGQGWTCPTCKTNIEPVRKDVRQKKKTTEGSPETMR